MTAGTSSSRRTRTSRTPILSDVSKSIANAYGVLSAVNTAVHHEFNVKGMERVERNALRMVSGEWDSIDAETLALLATV